MKAETIKNRIYNLKHGDYIYPITLQLIKDGRKNKVVNKKIKYKINVTMVHGQKDKVVPISYSKKIIKPTNEELEKHSVFLKSSLKKNFF